MPTRRPNQPQRLISFRGCLQRRLCRHRRHRRHLRCRHRHPASSTLPTPLQHPRRPIIARPPSQRGPPPWSSPPSLDLVRTRAVRPRPRRSCPCGIRPSGIWPLNAPSPLIARRNETEAAMRAPCATYCFKIVLFHIEHTSLLLFVFWFVFIFRTFVFVFRSCSLLRPCLSFSQYFRIFLVFLWQSIQLLMLPSWTMNHACAMR